MLGGLFCAIVAPLVFDWAYEHPLLIFAAAFLVPQVALLPWPRRHITLLTFALPVLALLLSFAVERFATGWWSTGGHHPDLAAGAGLPRAAPVAFASSLAALMLSYGGWTILQQSTTDIRTRSYFGIYQVTPSPTMQAPYERCFTARHPRAARVQKLCAGHGDGGPTSYYARRSAVGEALANAPQLYGPAARVGVVGLGTGTLSCYKQPGQSWSIYEIDPAMVEIARTRFSFLSKCAPDARIVLGDARLRLAEEAPNSMDILAVDAFSSDAVPMHLLTREALAVYGKAVQQDGIVLFHISNRYLDLKPVIADLAGERRMAFRPCSTICRRRKSGSTARPIRYGSRSLATLRPCSG
jgi:hypothetical protein